MKKKDLQEHILEVDDLQAVHYKELLAKIEQLEYKMESLRQSFEKSGAWVNQPVPFIPIRPDVLPRPFGTGDPRPYKVTVVCSSDAQQPHEFAGPLKNFMSDVQKEIDMVTKTCHIPPSVE